MLQRGCESVVEARKVTV
jgi:archaellum component FlaC